MRFHFSRLWVGRILFGRSPLLRALFARSAKIFRRRSGRSRGGVYQAGFDAVRSARSFASLGGFGALEARAMLAADDIVVSLVANQLVLTLDSAGTAITDLSTTFASKTRVLSITAASTGTLSLAAPITGVTIDPATDTISVDLKTLKTFAGISVVGSTGTDRVVIGKAGVNLSAVTKGAAAQSPSRPRGPAP